MPDESPKYLAIKNWEKYQPGYTNGKRARWIKSWVDKYDDLEYSRLSAFQRHILDCIRDLRGALGKNVPNDPRWIGKQLALAPQERSNVGPAVDRLTTDGFLVLSNQQNDTTTSVRRDKSRVEKRREESAVGPPERKKRVRADPPIVAWQGQLLKVSQPTADALKVAYPQIDTIHEYPKADAWMVAHPGKRKGTAAFITRWMTQAEAQIESRRVGGGNGEFKTAQERRSERNRRIIDEGLRKFDPSYRPVDEDI